MKPTMALATKMTYSVGNVDAPSVGEKDYDVIPVMDSTILHKDILLSKNFSSVLNGQNIGQILSTFSTVV